MLYASAVPGAVRLSLTVRGHLGHVRRKFFRWLKNVAAVIAGMRTGHIMKSLAGGIVGVWLMIRYLYGRRVWYWVFSRVFEPEKGG